MYVCSKSVSSQLVMLSKIISNLTIYRFMTEDKIDWQNSKTILEKIWQTPLENDILSIVD
jgi:hypothetical protein